MGALEKFLALAGKAKGVGKDVMLGKEVQGPLKMNGIGLNQDLEELGRAGGGLADLADKGKGAVKDALFGKEVHGPLDAFDYSDGKLDLGRKGGVDPKLAAALGLGGAAGGIGIHEAEDDDSEVNELLRKLGLK